MQRKDDGTDSLENLILEWNIEVPVDRWWRSKHGVAFNSDLHRGTSFIDMYWEFVEDNLHKKAVEKIKQREEHPYIPNTHDFVVPRVNSTTMSEQDFDDIEI